MWVPQRPLQMHIVKPTTQNEKCDEVAQSFIDFESLAICFATSLSTAESIASESSSEMRITWMRSNRHNSINNFPSVTYTLVPIITVNWRESTRTRLYDWLPFRCLLLKVITYPCGHMSPLGRIEVKCAFWLNLYTKNLIQNIVYFFKMNTIKA